MSADNDPAAPLTGEFRFRMPQPIPSYLMALAIGDLEFRPISHRCGVYAEPHMAAAAAREFEDAERMMQAAEGLYGPYRWGRYDILVLPPSFPFGGMENPKLTFATPTVIAGDKSLVSLVSHELAHSWSGNLVTNATWSDFWLNEGFTTYIEMRIQERLYGRARSEMEAVLGKQTLEKDLKEFPPSDQVLYVNLAGRDPDDGVTEVPYIKGMLFLRTLEEAFGRERFDAFVRGYFDRFAFQSITTAQFLKYLKANLLDQDPAIAARIPVRQWVFDPGLPAGAAEPRSEAFVNVARQAAAWYDGGPVTALSTSQWTTQEWLHFLRYFEERPLTEKRMAELDARCGFTKTGNAEIAAEWLLLAIRYKYAAADRRLEEFLTGVGRRKFVKPLYAELLKTPEGTARARAIFERARRGYHPITASTIAGMLKKGEAKS
jgi:aminopeptidase N